MTDSGGRRLSGRHRYRIRFARGKLPPADAFWSITMYESDGYLHPNAARRYAIGDRTPGLRRNADGSLTVAIQRARPAGVAAANWLPAPRGRFRMIMRVYEPRRSVLKARWKPPRGSPPQACPTEPRGRLDTPRPWNKGQSRRGNA